jgi:hypothetical protein
MDPLIRVQFYKGQHGLKKMKIMFSRRVRDFFTGATNLHRSLKEIFIILKQTMLIFRFRKPGSIYENASEKMVIYYSYINQKVNSYIFLPCKFCNDAVELYDPFLILLSALQSSQSELITTS